MVYLATYNLEGWAIIWWESAQRRFKAKSVARGVRDAGMTRSAFGQLFQDQFIGEAVRDVRQTQFDDLTQGNLSVLGYEHEFDRFDMSHNTMGWKSKRQDILCEGFDLTSEGLCDH